MRATGRQDAAAEEEFLQALYRGGELLAAGKIIEAKDHLEQAYKLQPRNEKGQNLLGLTYFKLGLFDRAAEIYEALVRENPADPTLRVNLGLVYLKTNALQRAVREFETATDLAPDHKKAHNYLGLALAQAGEYGQAREHFLLAGSDAMAEKMARALGGAGLPSPEPVPPARAEASSSPVTESRVAEAPPDESQLESPRQTPPEAEVGHPPPPPPEEEAPFEVMSEEEPPPRELEETAEGPASSWAGAPASDELVRTEPPPEAVALAPPLGADWGAQFGLDGPPAEQEMRFAEDEGPSAPPIPAYGQQYEEMPTLEATPAMIIEPASAGEPASVPPPEQLSYGEQAESYSPTDYAAESEQVASFPPVDPLSYGEQATSFPPTDEQPPVEAPTDEPLQYAPPVAEAAAASGAEEPADPLARIPAPPLREATIIMHPAAVRSDARDGQTISEVASSLLAFGEEVEAPFQVNEDTVVLAVRDELLARVAGVLAYEGALELLPEAKRYRGRPTDRPFGEGLEQLVRLRGSGAVLIARGGREFVVVGLGDEAAYFHEPCVFAFEEPVLFENGRVSAEGLPDLELVHLRGDGKVLLRLDGPMRSMQLRLDRPATIPLDRLVGWIGNVAPRLVPMAWSGDQPLRAAVELSGEGYALFSLAAPAASP